MTSAMRETTRACWAFPFLAALVAVLATLLSSAPASVATTAGPETRVGAHASSVEQFVGSYDQITAGQRLGNDAAGHGIVVATGAGAKTAALTEREIGSMMDDLPEGTSLFKQSKSAQYVKSGGFGQANLDFDALTRGVDVIEGGGGRRTATLSNGTKINVRPTSSGKLQR